jgi:hypothetical protein
MLELGKTGGYLHKISNEGRAAFNYLSIIVTLTGRITRWFLFQSLTLRYHGYEMMTTYCQ